MPIAFMWAGVAQARLPQGGWGWPETVAAASVVVALISLVYARQAARAAKDAVAAAHLATDVAKGIARRQHVIALYDAWRSVNDIDPKDPIGPHVREAANALSLTATMWNHDVVEREILFQDYWEPFSGLYRALDSTTKNVPGYNKPGRAFLTPSIRRAHIEMQARESSGVIQTRIPGARRSPGEALAPHGHS